MSAWSSNHQRGKNVVSASSGNATSWAPWVGRLLQQGDQPIDHLGSALGPRHRAHLGRGHP